MKYSILHSDQSILMLVWSSAPDVLFTFLNIVSASVTLLTLLPFTSKMVAFDYNVKSC